MSLTQVAFRNITFSYQSSQTQLFQGLNLHFPRGFSGIVGPNGAGKTTMLQLLAGQLDPDFGHVEGIENAIYCAQRTDSPPEVFGALLEDADGQTYALRGRLGIEDDYLERWDTLSHGERKRSQIACALWQSPDVLAIDEPTNHIDQQTKQQLVSALHQFRGVGLIVSHDRELLDDLCSQCIWLSPPEVSTYAGGYSAAAEQRGEERELQQKLRTQAVKDRNKIKNEQHVRRQQAEKAQRQLSKRHVDSKDHDAKAKINGAKLAGGSMGKRIRQLDGRLDRAEESVATSQVRKEYETGIWLPGSISKRNLLLDLEPMQINLGATRSLETPALCIQPTDRIALTGANGLGKSTLIQTLLPKLNVPPEHLIYMPQEISATDSVKVLETTRQLPRKQLGEVMNIVSRLGSRPNQLIESRKPSPGEIRKLLLALGMSRLPHLLILDEPTNHLDLPSIEALEMALTECPCAILLVSHDQRFLEKLASITWHISQDGNGDSHIEVGFAD